MLLKYLIKLHLILILIKKCTSQPAEQPLDSANVISLAGGRYKTLNDVTAETGIAFDVRDIKLSAKNKTRAILLYNQGYYGIQTTTPPTTISLAKLSKTANSRYKSDPLYNTYKYGFSFLAPEGSFDNEPEAQYADSIVNDLFQENRVNAAAEASVVMNVWMEVVHHLYDVVRYCDAKNDNLAQISLDKAAAFYIGRGQEQGENQGGYLLYHLAEIAGYRFDQDVGETLVNKKILDFMNMIRFDIGESQKCSAAEAVSIVARKQTRRRVDRIIAQMGVPIVQKLIHEMYDLNNRYLIELYAVAIIPQLVGCSGTDYKKMVDVFITKKFTEKSQFDEVVATLQKNYQCLGITCEDVGAYLSDVVPLCKGNDMKSLAGYTFGSNFTKQATIDLDLLQITNFLEMNGTEAAMDYYVNGHNSKTSKKYQSLQNFATSVRKDGLPSRYASFEAYHNSSNYLNQAVVNAIKLQNDFKIASAEQRVVLTQEILRSKILFFHPLVSLYNSLVLCKGGNLNSAVMNWDIAASTLIGSLEGITNGGSNQGLLFYSLIKINCYEFGTCDNYDLISLLSNGKSQISFGSCSSLQTTVQEIEILMVITLIQNTLRYAALQHNDHDDETVSAGYIASTSVVPLFYKVGVETAVRNIIFQMRFRTLETSTKTDADSVFSSFKTAMTAIADWIDCGDIGELQGYGGVCANMDYGDIDENKTAASYDDYYDDYYNGKEINDTSLSLAQGRYVASFYMARSISKLAIDAKEMSVIIHTSNGSNDALIEIYNDGKYADSKNGLWSFSDLSTSSETYLMNDPIFTVYQYGFQPLTSNGEIFDGEPINLYADSLVRDLLELNKNTQAVEAMLVMNLWMYVVNSLNNVVLQCEKKSDESALEYLDSAAAAYIGDNQLQGKIQGYLLYAIAEKVARFFNQRSDEESTANFNIMNQMNKIKELLENKGCSSENAHVEVDTYEEIRIGVDSIISYMTLPLVQNLIHQMYLSSDSTLSKLYALAFLPQIRACDEDSFETLIDFFVRGNYEVGNFTDAMLLLEENYDCLGIKCADIGDYIGESTLTENVLVPSCKRSATLLAGYTPASEVAEVSQIDLDIYQIGILIDMGQYEAGKDYYVHGHNSRHDGDYYQSLRGMALAQRMQLPSYYAQYQKLYDNDPNFVNSLILSAINKKGIFEESEHIQRKVLVDKFLRYMLMFLHPLDGLYSSYKSCRVSTNAQLEWDIASSFLIGSKEGEQGSESGILMYALIKKTCPYFGTCNFPNHDLIGLLNLGKSQIANQQCDGLYATVKYIEKLMQITLIQNTLKLAVYLDGQHDDATIADAFASASSILPILHTNKTAVIETAIRAISYELRFRANDDATVTNAARVFNSFKVAIRGYPSISCGEIGEFVQYGNVCQDSTSIKNSNVATTTPSLVDTSSWSITKGVYSYHLAEGRYIATTYGIEERAKIAYDVKDMMERNQTEALYIYNEGKNSFNEDGELISLADFSTYAYTEMREDPTYNIYKFAFSALGDGAYFDDEPLNRYADSIVNDLFEIGKVNEAIEASITMNLWMYVVHNLHDVVLYCSSQWDEDALHSLDLAAAYWIGDGQSIGDNNNGFLLYALTEKAGERFMQDFGETSINTKILDLMNDVKENILLPGKCSQNAHSGFDALIKLRIIVDDIIALMTVPLLQNLYFQMRSNTNPALVELYAVSVIPQLAGCQNSTFRYLLEEFITDKYQTGHFADIVKTLQDSYSCLRISCADVGSFGNVLTECVDKPANSVMAGYVPTSNVKEYAEIDLDILQIGIFLRMGALKAADLYYRYGHNSRNGNYYHSLHNLATEKLSSIQSLYNSYVSYFDEKGMDNFVDSLVTSVLSEEGIFADARKYQKQPLVITALRFIVMILQPIAKLNISVEKCKSNDRTSTNYNWDVAAAHLIGSIEGQEEGGSADGQLAFAVIKAKCDEFETCDLPNHNLIKLLSTGKELIYKEDCEGLSDIGNKIQSLLEATLIQSVLLDAAKLNEEVTYSNFAQGYVLSLSILPTMNDVDTSSTKMIETEFLYSDQSLPTSFNSQRIFLAFSRAMNEKKEWACEDVGSLEFYGGVCPPKVESMPNINIQSSNSLAGGRYVTSTGAESWAKISDDVKEMKSATKDEAFNIYLNGKFASSNGIMLSLGNFSSSAPQVMAQDPLYNIYVYAFLIYQGEVFDGQPVSKYADTIVKDLFELDKQAEGIEAALVMNLWMYVAYMMHESVRLCKENLDSHALFSLDVAASLWIGEDQEEGDEEGHLLYALAERAGAKFEQNSSGETRVNRNILDLMNEAKKMFVEERCSASNKYGSRNAFTELRSIVDRIIAQMTVPLLQNFIHYMKSSDNSFMLELYTFSFVPQIVGCNKATFNFMVNEIVTNRFQDKNFAMMYSIIQRSLSCLHLSCGDLGSYHSEFRVPNCVNTPNSEALAGYIPTSANITEHSEIDLDIHQIKIFMDMGAYEAAKDYFLYGHNSRNANFYYSLNNLKPQSNSIVSLLYQSYVSYFGGDEKFTETLVIDAIQKEGQFGDALPNQRAEIVMKTIQQMIMYIYPISELYLSLEFCRTSIEEATNHWDKGAASLIGSIEGNAAGGNQQGQLFYALTKQFCAEFGTCNMTGHDIVGLLKTGQGQVQGTKCNELRNTTDSIRVLLDVTNIQATLNYAAVLKEEPSPASIAAGFTSALSILPLIKHADHVSGLVIEDDMGFATSLNKGELKTNEIFEAFETSLQNIDSIDCADVGALENFGDVCPEPPIQPGKEIPKNTHLNPSKTVSLSTGLYVATSNVDELSKIALDVRDIIDALSSGDVDLAKMIYKIGLNAHKFDQKGKLTGEKWSLASFSEAAGDDFIHVPQYSIFKYALRGSGPFEGDAANEYANSFVMSSFQSNTKSLGAEAAVVLNVWMFITNKLYEVVEKCRKSSSTSLSPLTNLQNMGGSDTGLESLDQAASLWIGSGQTVGESNGYLLYTLTQEIAHSFGMRGFGQSAVNTKIMSRFNEAKTRLSVANSCSKQSDAPEGLKHIADEIVSLMTIPLMQNLIKALVTNDLDRISLYALSVVPLIAGCSPSSYAYLKEKLIDTPQIKVSEINEIILKLQSSFDCLGFSCTDIGYYSNEGCNGVEPLSPLAGYTPSSDVRKHAKIDLDILHINIMMKMEAYDVARDIYIHGKHSNPGGEYLSLQGFATSTNRDMVPQYKDFRYFFDDTNYADSIITKAISKVFPFNDASIEQRTEVVTKTLSSMVMYMQTLQELYEAINDCESGVNTKSLDGVRAWDKAAAYIIGSIESSENGGASWYDDGQLLFGLAKQRCIQFGTCDPSTGNADVNEEIIELLYAGQSEAKVFNCKALKESVHSIEPLLLTPLIQSTLRAAIQNENLAFFSTDASLADGFVYSSSVIPVINVVNPSSANIIKKNMDFQFTVVPVIDGAPAVFHAFEEGIKEMNGVDCNDIGSIQAMNVCRGGSSGSSTLTITKMMLITFFSFTIALMNA